MRKPNMLCLAPTHLRPGTGLGGSSATTLEGVGDGNCCQPTAQGRDCGDCTTPRCHCIPGSKA